MIHLRRSTLVLRTAAAAPPSSVINSRPFTSNSSRASFTPQSRHREFATTCLLRAITGHKQLQQIAALFDRLVAWTSNVGEIVMPGATHRLRLYWTKFAHTAKYKIKPQATAIDTSQIAIFPNLGTLA
jgi:hypothetical protein